MKLHPLIVLVSTCCLALPLWGADYRITERGADFTVWTADPAETNAATLRTAASYVELETGKHYLEDGQWKESLEEIELVEDGAVARQLPYKVRFGTTLASPVQVRTPDGKDLKFRVLGFAYYDFIARRYVTFAEATNCVGQLISSNQVVYPGAVQGGGLVADVRYTVRKAGIEQDFIIRRAPTDALPERFSFNPVSTRLLALTEFLSPPDGVRTVERVRRGWKKAKVARIIDFGTMKMGHGSAFMLGTGSQRKAGLAVEKHWQVIDGRTVLMEEVNFRDVAPMLSRLQAGTSGQATRNSNLAMNVTTNMSLPAARLLARTGKEAQMKMAAVEKRDPSGVVIDFPLESGTGITLEGGITYVVTGTVNLTNGIIEGGTVVKFNRGARLDFYSPPQCQTGPYRPAVFTAVDDNSVGEVINGSNGSPTGRYAETALYLHDGGELSQLRILHAKEAIFGSANGYTLSDSQILFADRGLHAVSAGFTCKNVLMNQVLTNFYGVGFNGEVDHLTSDETSVFAWDPDFNYQEWCQGTPSSSVDVLNSIVVSLTNGYGIPSVTRAYVDEYATAGQVFVSAAGGQHYLRVDSPSRNAGSTGFYSAESLREKTTDAPLVCENTTFGSAATLSRWVQRDTDVPDLGYHYDPLDYLFQNVTIANATLTLRDGVAIGVAAGASQSGIVLQTGGKLVSTGSPLNLNRIVHHSLVQEQSLPGASGGLVGTSLSSLSGELRLNWTFLAGRNSLVSGSYLASASFRDCQFYGGQIELSGDPSYLSTDFCTWQVNNCLFHRVLVGYGFGAVHASFYNNLWVGGEVCTDLYNGSTFLFRDNFFDCTSLGDVGCQLDRDYNAYIDGYGWDEWNPTLWTPTEQDVVIAPGLFTYAPGPFGDYYQVSTNLSNMGSRSASEAGLYEYTTTTNQVKEAGSAVDIGLHYVAAGPDGLPLDSDENGIPDYLEDESNGTAGSEPPPDGGPDLVFPNGLAIWVIEPKPFSHIP